MLQRMAAAIAWLHGILSNVHSSQVHVFVTTVTRSIGLIELFL